MVFARVHPSAMRWREGVAPVVSGFGGSRVFPGGGRGCPGGEVPGGS